MVDPESSHVLDLLHAVPIRRIDAAKTRLDIALAFASGVSTGLFSEALGSATLAPSSWEPGSFARDLFLQRFAASCFQLKLDRDQPMVATPHLVQVLAHPPADSATVHLRRAILAELVASPELRAALERLYQTLCRFRGLLEGTSGAPDWDVNRRKLDLLQLVKELIDGMAEEFAAASSGLSRLATFAQRVRAGEPYRSLCDLLRYDERLATVSLEVGVGADGRIRGFQIVSVDEDQQNPFVSSAWRRWLAKLELFVRGFRFSDGEVMARLVDAVFDGLEAELVGFVQLLGDLEFYLGALGFRDFARAAGLAVCLPELVGPDHPRSLEALFNPLLLASGIAPVPCDLADDQHATTTLVTGPNSGGKTRLLQSLGLTQLLAQSGSFIPARSGSLTLTPALVVSLIQETRADQAEGRLGMELMRIRDLFEQLPPGAMVLLDELCSGTNPSEGEEIFELVVKMLAKLKPRAFITTHFLGFAARLERQSDIPGLRFLQVELGEDRRATYQFAPGVARTSLAGHAAERLGITADQLTQVIERNIRQAQPASRGE
jgi:DNA mismatch repair protein MutS2